MQPGQQTQPQQFASAQPQLGASAGIGLGKEVKTQVKAPKSNPNSTQNTLKIAEIRDGIVIMDDGSFRAVVMTKSINFDLMSPTERESVEYGYQGFINSLFFPIQIFLRSTRVDLRPYMEKLNKIRMEHENMLLALLMEDYIDFISALTEQVNIMDKRFYVVIPFYPTVDAGNVKGQGKKLFGDLLGFTKNVQQVLVNEADLNKAKTELRNRVQSVLSGLAQVGVQGLPLDTQELIELYYDTYNPDTASRQPIKDFDALNAPVITKGYGEAPRANLVKEG
jgi:hypothetical protein